jgi:hypothetical protein
MVTNIVVDDVLLARLGNLQSPAILRDSSGRALGYITPAVDPSLYAELEPEISEEELAEREALGGGRPLADILADLEKYNT